MSPRLAHKLLVGAPLGSSEQELAGVRVVKVDLARRLPLLLEERRGAFPVASALGVVPVEVADVIRDVDSAASEQDRVWEARESREAARDVDSSGVPLTPSADPAAPAWPMCRAPSGT